MANTAINPIRTRPLGLRDKIINNWKI